MSSSVQKFYLDQEWFEQPKETEPLSKGVENILELFELLSVEDKVTVKKLLKNKNVF